MENWLNRNENDNGLVLSSRIRLARNLKSIPFPDKLSNEEGRKVIDDISNKFSENSYAKEKFRCIHLWENDNNSNVEFLEKHLISKKLIENRDKSAFILNDNETISIMLNEEDHIRLQGITGGFNLKKAYEELDKVDDLLEQNVDYAFDEKLGYLTACPTNLGTGMRASVMIHLPSLSMNKEMSGILNALTQIGITIRGLFGEGSAATGSLYQVSNQVTLGIKEEDIISNLKAVIEQIINQENLCREQIYKKYKYELEDKIFRSLGILKNAVILDSSECLNLISNVRMGIEMGVISDVNIHLLDSLIVTTQRAAIRKNCNNNMSMQEENIKRAEYVKESLK